jgi:hypothetical protein
MAQRGKGHGTCSPSRSTKGTNALPYLAAALGLVVSAALVGWTVQPGAYFSGDGGLKALAVRMHAHGHLSVFDFPVTPEIQAAWQAGLFPFGPPFVESVAGRPTLVFPPLFQLLTTPFFLAVGEWGLYVLPVLGFGLFLFSMALAGRRLGHSTRIVTLEVCVAGFTLPLTPYSATFWEHTLAVGLLALSIACLVDDKAGTALAAGATAVFAGALRPEVFLFVLLAWLTLVALPFFGLPRKRLLTAFAGGVPVIVLTLAVNFVFTKRLLGLHGEQVFGAGLAAGAPERFLSLLLQLFLFFPIVLLMPLLLKAHLAPAHAFTRNLVLTALLFTLAVPALLPNAGGKQLGPRYLLVWAPVAVIGLGSIFSSLGPRLPRKRVVRSLVAMIFLLCAGWGTYLNLILGARTLKADYSLRVSPALSFLHARTEATLVFTHQWSAQELTSLMPERAFFRIQGLDGRAWPDEDRLHPPPMVQLAVLDRYLRAQAQRTFLLVALSHQTIARQYALSQTRVVLTPLTSLGQFDIYLATCYRGGTGSST